MFTQPCFVRKNTPELRKKLEELGYKDSVFDDLKSGGIITFSSRSEYSVLANYHFNRVHALKSHIDCGTNEELFLALAALRDDSDYMQWFVSQTEKDSPKVFIKSTTHSCTQSLAYTHRWDWRCSKATIKEIIKHFKDK